MVTPNDSHGNSEDSSGELQVNAVADDGAVVVVDGVTSEENVITSLQDDLASVNKSIGFLKNFNPEKRRPGRPCKQPSTDSINSIPISNFEKHVIMCLESIEKVNVRMIRFLEDVDKTTVAANVRIDSLERKKTFADTVVDNEAFPELAEANGARRRRTVPPTVELLNSKCDTLEQESLSHVIICQGPVIDTLLEESKNMEVPLEKIQAIKRKVLSTISEISEEVVRETDIEKIFVMGKERKQLKIECPSRYVKERLLRCVKRAKPDNLYCSEYLTKARDAIFYKARCLRKSNDSVVSVFTRNGSIMCKLANSTKLRMINSEAELEIFVRELNAQ